MADAAAAPAPAAAAAAANPPAATAATTAEPAPPVSSAAAPSPPPPAEDAPPAAPQQFDPLEALKLGSQRLARLIQRAGHKPAQDSGVGAINGSSGEAPVVARIRATAAGLSARAKQQGSSFYAASLKTADSIKRLALGEPLQGLCRAECAAAPVPQLVLAVCTALVSGGGAAATPRLFKHDPPAELVERLSRVAGAAPCGLLPAGASPHALAALLKQFLAGLPEPLLTYRLLPQWVAAGDVPASAAALAAQLPPANANTLRLLIQVLALVHANAAQTEMDAVALAAVLAPCVAWKPPLKPAGGPPGGALSSLRKTLSLNTSAAAPSAAAAAGDGQQGGDDAAAAAHHPAGEPVPLDDAELEGVVTVLQHMVATAAASPSGSGF